MHPTATERAPATFMWADVIPLHEIPVWATAHTSTPVAADVAHSGVALRPAQPQGTPTGGPIKLAEGRMAEHMVQVAYNAQHEIPWHWPVPAYLVTKGIGAGIFAILSLGAGLNIFPFDSLTYVVGGFLSLLFILITTGLLVHDLEKPSRFLYILLRPQWKSWLTRGAFILISFSIVAGLWWLIEAGVYFEILDTTLVESIRPWALWIGLPLAIGVAIYTAFLFGQAEGRDLWQSTLLPFHLLLQALMVGSGVLLIVAPMVSLPQAIVQVITVTFIGSVILDVGVTLMGEFGMPHASEVAARAAHDISHGRYKNHFWWGSIALGHAIPLGLMMVGGPLPAAIAAVCAMIGLFLFEYAFVMAPQDIPNS
jgi:formate-dependent nitrite reductase membrane component NrfD